MRLLVTADVHLSADRPERFSALEEVVQIAKEHKCEYLLIAGDLFDAGTDVDVIKRQLREVFTGNEFQTLVIPGNHDETAFRDEDYFGNDIEILANRPFEQIDLGQLNLLAVPFFPGSFADIIAELRNARRDDAVNVLMVHGTLSTTRGTVFGEESRYLPFTPEELLETGADYVFAGHVHSRATKKSYGDGACVFASPGSPVSITTKETGRRGAWLFDTENDELRLMQLDSPYFVRERVILTPGETSDQLDDLETRLATQDLASATLLLEPRGFTDMDEEACFSRLEHIAENAEVSNYRIDRSEVESAASILESGLFRGFEQKLEERESIDDRRVREIVLRAMSMEARE